ncbi:MAG TPA: transporter substrate-binding domain-containing protein [Thermodesulfovibrionales bacterium]|nr:transporter substrate-binding domain-containing protein [Thermodesulfovibrionales bacterium]
MYKSRVGITLLILSLFVLGGTTTAAPPLVTEAKNSPLQVGVTPDNPPMIFKINDRLTGAEADFAKLLGKELDRQVQFVELPWNQQINALLDGRIDIIMSSMTITEARKVRITFTDPYLKSGLGAAIRASDASKYRSVKNIKEDFPAVGVMEGTTSEAYVRKNMPNSPRILALRKLSDAAIELKNRRIDVFIYDAPAIVWLVSENEADLRGVWELFNEEHLGWGVRRDDKELLLRVNTVLNKWKNDGTLKEVLSRWLPYWKNFEF